MAGTNHWTQVPTQGSSGLLLDIKPNLNYTSKGSSTRQYTAVSSGVRRKNTKWWQQSKPERSSFQGCSTEVSVHEATQAEWSLTVQDRD